MNIMIPWQDRYAGRSPSPDIVNGLMTMKDLPGQTPTAEYWHPLEKL